MKFNELLKYAIPAMEWTYTDRLTVRRATQVVNTYNPNSSDNTYSDEPIHSDIPCKVSFSLQSLKRDNPKNSYPDINPLMEVVTFFTSNNIDIKKGDETTVEIVDSNGDVLETYSGICGEPHVFVTHQEVFFYIEGEA